ncbi:MAG: hypothetical protein HFG26_00330 [Provencibacterium sp.]|jgi:competence protein ComEC|nr:hypothetical protein [Provencibacterium sp.]
MRRPMFGIGVVFFLSTAAALIFGFNFAVATGLFLLLCSGLALLLVRRYRGTAACLLLAAALAMGLAALREARYLRPVEGLAGRTVYLKGRVTEITYYDQNARYLLDARIPLQDGRELKTNLLLYAHTPLPTHLNEELSGYVSLTLPGNKGKYRWLNLSKRILLSGSFSEEPQITAKAQAERTPGYYIGELREYLVRQNERLLPGDAAALASAMLLGQKQRVSDEVQLDFRRAGLIHLMAVSGFHVTLVAALLLGIFRIAGIPRRWGGLLVLPFLLLFVAVAGFTASAVRAGLMTGLGMAALALREQYDPPSALGFAILAECICDPYSALGAGFLLSFSACAGILFAGPAIRAWLCRVWGAEPEETGRLRRMLRESFAISLAAFLFTLPVQIYLFDTFSLIAPVASVLSMPVATGMLWCAAVALLLAAVPFLFPLARILSLATGLLARLLSSLAAGFSAIPFAVLPVRYEFIKWLVMVFYLGALLLAIGRAAKRTRRFCALLAVGVLAAGLGSAQLLYRDTAQLTIFSGMDAAVLVRGNRAALIGFPKTFYQSRVIESYLRDLQIRSLELALSTNLDNEESLGAASLFRKYPPRQVVMPAAGRYTENILHALPYGQRVVNRARIDQLETMGIGLKLLPCSCGAGCSIDFGGANLLKTNEDCVIMKGDYQTQGIIRGWMLVKERRDGKRMKVSEDGDRLTTYTFRIQKGE